MIETFILACLFLIPASEKLKTYVDEQYKYSMSYPEAWEKVDYQGSVVFLSTLENETDSFRENINIMVQDLSANPMTLDEYTELSKKEVKTMFGKEFLSLKDLSLGKHKAKEVIYDIPKNSIPGALVTLKTKQIWLIHSNKAYVVSYTAAKDKYNTYLETTDACQLSFKLE